MANETRFQELNKRQKQSSLHFLELILSARKSETFFNQPLGRLAIAAKSTKLAEIHKLGGVVLGELDHA